MDSYRLRLTPEAKRLFTRFHPEVKQLIKSAFKEIVANPYSGKELHSDLMGWRSFRTRRYRIIYRVNTRDNFIDVIYIGHRRSVYVELKSLIGE